MKFQDMPEQVAIKLREETTKGPIAGVKANGFSFAYTRPSPMIPGVYVFSAMLQPEGRGSTTDDWDYLGKVMGFLGVPLPEGPERFKYFTDVATADPNSVLKWVWTDSHASASEKAQARWGVNPTPAATELAGTPPGDQLLEGGKARLVLHTDPKTVGTSELALLIGLMGSAAHMARTLPGLKLPVHVMVEINGQKLCANAEAIDSGSAAEHPKGPCHE